MARTSSISTKALVAELVAGNASNSSDSAHGSLGTVPTHATSSVQQKKTCLEDRPGDGEIHFNALKHQMQWLNNCESQLF